MNEFHVVLAPRHLRNATQERENPRRNFILDTSKLKQAGWSKSTRIIQRRIHDSSWSRRRGVSENAKNVNKIKSHRFARKSCANNIKIGPGPQFENQILEEKRKNKKRGIAKTQLIYLAERGENIVSGRGYGKKVEKRRRRIGRS